MIVIVRSGTVPCDVSLVFGSKNFGCRFLLGRYGFWVVGFGVVVGKGVVSLIVWALVVVCGGGGWIPQCPGEYCERLWTRWVLHCFFLFFVS